MSCPPEWEVPASVIGLLTHAGRQGFIFGRMHGGSDAPLFANRVTGPWLDTIFLEGFGQGQNVCNRYRLSDCAAIDQFRGHAIGVINHALAWPE